MLVLSLSINHLISKNKLKQYQQLHLKKFRQKYGLFVVEGSKSVNELLNSDYEVEHIVCTDEEIANTIDNQAFNVSIISQKELAKISSFKNPQSILAIAKIRELKLPPTDWSIALDNINDPGNLGTILRIADWYNIRQIYCSHNCVDLFNPKLIQASMGSFCRLAIHYCDLSEVLKTKEVYAAVLNGENIRKIEASSGTLLIGNEANGISQELLASIKHRAVSIPGDQQTESLNAAVATAICCERLLF